MERMRHTGDPFSKHLVRSRLCRDGETAIPNQAPTKCSDRRLPPAMQTQRMWRKSGGHPLGYSNPVARTYGILPRPAEKLSGVFLLPESS